MQYDAIILELMSRIKKLEDEVAQLKSAVLETEMPDEADSARTKMTEQMIGACYALGKKAYQAPELNLWDCADQVVQETGMNRSSAFMYIYAVKNMLSGTVYKRAINAAATKKYLGKIAEEFGKEGLARAISAVRKHTEYRRDLGQTVDSVIGICDKYQEQLNG